MKESHYGGDCVTFDVKRVALNMKQIRAMDPKDIPPNPVKRHGDGEFKDPRGRAYVEKYGPHSWELDALDPDVLADLVTKAVERERDDDLYKITLENQERHRKAITRHAAIFGIAEPTPKPPAPPKKKARKK